MCMPLPDGYGSISSWYQCVSSAAPGGGLGVWNVRSSSQTRCHFRSISWGSYLFMDTKKPLAGEAWGSSARTGPRWLPALEKELHPLHFAFDCSNSLTSSHGELHEAQLARGRRGPVAEVRPERDGVPQRAGAARAGELGSQRPPRRPELPRPVRP